MGSRDGLVHAFGVVCLALLVSLVVLVLSVAAATGSGMSGTVPGVRILNFGKVSDAYYRGSQPYLSDYADLAALGVRTVIDLQDEGDDREPERVRDAGMTYVRMPMTHHEPPTADQLARFLALVNDPARQPVYVHCTEGRHRTGVMTAVYRMTGEGWSAGEAFKEMKRYRFGADVLHPEFKQFVLTYRPADHPIGLLTP